MKIQTFGKRYLGLQKRIFLNLTNPKRFQRNFEAQCLRFTSKFFELVTVFFLTLEIQEDLKGYRVPFRQRLMFGTVLKVKKILEDSGIEFVIVGGSLLGAQRDGSFAGRPADFDIAIKEKDYDKLLSLDWEFWDGGLSLLDWSSYRSQNFRFGGIVHIWPFNLNQKTRWGMIDVHVYARQKDEWFFKGRDYQKDNPPSVRIPISFPGQKTSSSAKIFGIAFPIPTNAEIYLEQSFGKDWKIPLNHRQFLKSMISMGTADEVS